MKISELLRLAADEYLWDGKGEMPEGGSNFSCCAVELAFYDNGGKLRLNNLLYKTLHFLESLGVNTSSEDQFNEFNGAVKKQGARFLWLHFAALVAEDEEKLKGKTQQGDTK